MALSSRMTRSERLALEKQARDASKQADQEEIEQRISDHKLKVTRHTRAKEFRTIAKAKLDFLAIGDSWFDYPLDGNYLLPPYSFGIVADQNLGSMGNPSPLILSFAKAGAAFTSVLSYENQEKMISVLRDPSQWANGKGPDAILVSAGGDDIVGDQLAIYLKYGGGVAAACARIGGVLGSVSSSYEDLFALRDLFAPGVPIFGHCYDYALPNGLPAALILGPWLKPSFDFALYDSADAQDIVKDMIDKLYALLTGLASNAANNFHLVNTRNTIASNNTSPDGWANELHPYPTGFHKVAQKFLTVLQGHFPGRI
jgi:hypothetical protein